MGTVVSSSADSIAELATGNELLKRLAGQERVDSNDPRWNQLFSFNFRLDQRSRKVQTSFLEAMAPLLEQMMHNTRETGNFAALVRVFNRRCAELEASAKCENKIFLWQAANALLLIRYIATFLAQRLSPSEFARVFGASSKQQPQQQKATSQDENTVTLAQQLAEAIALKEVDSDAALDTEEEQPYESAAEHLLTNLVHILTQIPVNQLTLQLHAETLRLLLALLSTQLYESAVNERSEFLRLLMLKFRSQSGELVRVLLENFLRHHSEPLDLDVNESGGDDSSSSSSLVISLWSSLQRTLTFGGGGSQDEDFDQFPVQSLASLSLSLLLSLVYYPSFGDKQNPYKQMLSIFQNAQEVSSLANLEASFKLDFSHLYRRLCQTVHGNGTSAERGEGQPLLLLYLLIHNNIGFRHFLLSRINLEQLVLPVTRVLYDGMCQGNGSSSSGSPSKRRASALANIGRGRQSSTTSGAAAAVCNSTNADVQTHQVYLSLIVLLMFSEDDFFKKVIHEMIIKNVDWYQPDRAPLSEVTLGGLLVLVFAKTIQVNTVRIRDRYFHVNSLATLANLSSCFKQLSPLVCQKLIGLLETMTKRHAKLIRLLRENAECAPAKEEKAAAASNLVVDEFEEANDDLHRDITALEEGIRTVLEIINACLCHNLRNNPDLIYTVLYKRELFEHYHQHPMFQDLVWNIYAVINHFTGRVEALIKANGGEIASGAASSTSAIASNASVAEILEAIKKTAIQWPTDRLKKFPDLRFKYIEDENTVDFFIPYIWRLIHEGAGILFDADAIQLFRAMD